jgi:uncharacterized membrane protein YciS (DUF1049 family)
VTATLFVALRRLLIAVIAVICLLIAAVLAYVNPDPIALDVGLMRFDRVSVSMVVTFSFAAGAIFGGILTGFGLLNHFRERRVLRRNLKRAERELETLRSLLLPDAD